MKTLKNYILHAFFSTFLSTVAVFTFVLSIGGLFKLTDLVSKGIPPGPILTVFLSGMPQALAFSIPISAVTATLLVFGRLSADSEITAMRACGVSLWQIVGWMLPVGFLLLMTCVYINSELLPRSHYASRTATAHLKVINPVDLIEEGRTIRDFDGLSLYVERKRGDVLEGVRIFDQREEGFTREIKAERGIVSMPTNSNDVVLSLEVVTIDPFSFERPGKADAARWTVRVADARRNVFYRQRDKDLTLAELYLGAKALRQDMHSLRLEVARLDEEAAALNRHRPETETNQVVELPRKSKSRRRDIDQRMVEQNVRLMKMMVEFHKRLALSGASFAFVVLGIPLGIRSHRKESSIGVAVSLVAVFVFYMFVLLAEQLATRPEFRPDLLCWIPVVTALLMGAWMIRRLH
ncbi:MAG TPA: hypothetical protein DCS43_07580 [Verrucomicrobia bacterium]|nr:hypothetical protein [Verrucomicrobiota bacterium]